MIAPRWSKKLVCEWEAWVADEALPVLRLYLPLNNCCDMAGAIEVAMTLMPGVQGIAVYSGGVLDVEYGLVSGGAAWEVLSDRRLSEVYYPDTAFYPVY